MLWDVFLKILVAFMYLNGLAVVVSVHKLQESALLKSSRIMRHVLQPSRIGVAWKLIVINTLFTV